MRSLKVLTFRVISVGKSKFRTFDPLILEFKKRLASFANLELIEVPNFDRTSKEADIRIQQEKEAQAILAKVEDNSWLIALDSRGKELSSEQFATLIKNKSLSKKRFVFVIGGSNGLSELILKKADFVISFSRMTFPHELIKVFLIEQLYRVSDILTIKKYHK